MRVVKVPRFTGFIIDAITPLQNSHYFTLTMRESESRRVFTKDVAFSELAVKSERNGNYKEDFFGYVFGMGEGAARETSLEIRAAIREGRVIRGMTKDQVELAMGEANEKVREPNGEFCDGAEYGREWVFIIRCQRFASEFSQGGHGNAV